MKRVALALGAAALAAALIHSLRRHRGDPEEIVRAYFDAWSDGDGDAMRDLVSDDYQAHVRTLEGTEERGAEELIAVVGSHADAFEEVEYELHDVLCHDGHVAVRATMHARHQETGREGDADGIAILRLDGDRIAEEWSSWDYVGLVDQLGLREDE
jgi:ketosteroid isomerase-like protein